MLRPWQVRLRDRIAPSSGTPMYMQIMQALVRDIEGGHIPADTYLPSTRALATALGVNRKTVVLAYEDLIAQGWLVSTSTKGTRVSSLHPDEHRPHEPQDPARDTDGADYFFHKPPERPIALPPGKGLKLDEGAPDGRLFPIDRLAGAYRAAIARVSRDSDRLLYGDPRGLPALRECIATMLRSQRGLSVTADNICITRGSQNGIFLAAQTLVRPGDHVIVESLTYEPAVAAFRAAGAKILSVSIDSEGLSTDEVERLCRRHTVRAIFVTPHHQFPTTISLRPERRLKLLMLARQFGFAVIEDDYDHEFHFDSQPLMPMATYAPNHVLYVGSLSKLLLPALRIGYVAAPTAVVDALAHAASMTDAMGNSLTEGAVVEIIESGELRRHARKVRQIYAKRRLDFAAELDKRLGGLVEYRLPDGGLAFWIQFKTDIQRLERQATALGLRFAPSESFMTRPDAPRGLRIGFASHTLLEIQQALDLLREAVR